MLRSSLWIRKSQTKKKWVRDFSKILKSIQKKEVKTVFVDGRDFPVASKTELVFVDGGIPNLSSFLKDRKSLGGVFILVNCSSRMALESWKKRKIDDFILSPFRSAEIEARIRFYQDLLNWEKVSQLNERFGTLIAHLKDHVQVAKRLHAHLIPEPNRLPQVEGLGVGSRYLAGWKSGGDYFDLTENPETRNVSFFVTDSSSYGLSSTVISFLMKSAAKLSASAPQSCHMLLRLLYDELVSVLGEKDHLSIFFGIFLRTEMQLRFLNLGGTQAFLARKNQRFQTLPGVQSPLQKSLREIPSEHELKVDPEDRILILSDGFVEGLGGVSETLSILDAFREKKSRELLDELVFQMKSQLNEDDLPTQDCTALLLDVDSNVVRLKRTPAAS